MNRRKEMGKAVERLKMLEKLEDYREKKMQQEIEVLEQERLKEQLELEAAKQKEIKYAKYLEKQKDKLQQHLSL